MSIRSPFFLFFVSRSGSTFLANELMRRARVVLLPEANFVPPLIEAARKQTITSASGVLEVLQADTKFSDWQLDFDEIRRVIDEKVPLTAAEAIGAICGEYAKCVDSETLRFGFKKGSYVNHFRNLKATFPDAKFIGLIRDGRAVFNSQRQAIYWKTGKPFETDAAKCATLWQDTVQLLREIEKRHRESTLIVHYENLVRDTDKVMDTVLQFLELEAREYKDVDVTCYDIPARYKNIHGNIGRPPLEERISAWRDSLCGGAIGDFEKIAFKTLEAEGYELVRKRPQRSVFERLGLKCQWSRSRSA